jgi:hypothetical protein
MSQIEIVRHRKLFKDGRADTSLPSLNNWFDAEAKFYEVFRKVASHTCGRCIGPMTRLLLKQSQTSTSMPAGTLNATGSPVFICTPFGFTAPLLSINCSKRLRSHVPVPVTTHHFCTSSGFKPLFCCGVAVGGSVGVLPDMSGVVVLVWLGVLVGQGVVCCVPSGQT